METKQNCWEYMQCGREPGGSNMEKYGICAAAIAYNYHGTNHGTSAGRFCWKIAGTFCAETIKGLFAREILSCMECPFFQQVKMQEGRDFT
jgi:hypothetical protein